MSHEFKSALAEEIASLEAELETDVRYVRLRELRRLLPLYGEAAPSPASSSTQMAAAPKPRQSVRQSSPTREQALKVVKDYVSLSGRVVPTRELLDHLVAKGVELGGANPLNNLSALMSTSGLFQAHGRAGWTLSDKAPPVLDQSDYDAIVNAALSELPSDEMAKIRIEVEAHNNVPPYVDRRLLELSRERTRGKFLIDSQTKVLRTTFMNRVREPDQS